MGKRLRAARAISYPDAKSLPIVVAAGGMSKLTDEQRKKVKIREVEAGGWCDDVPLVSLAGMLESGSIVEVEADPVKRATTRGAK